VARGRRGATQKENKLERKREFERNSGRIDKEKEEKEEKKKKSRVHATYMFPSIFTRARPSGV